MSKYLVDSTDMTAIADAIRQKDGSQTTMTVSDMPTRIENIPSGGGTDYMYQRVAGTLTSYTLSNDLYKISAYSFARTPLGSQITIPHLVNLIDEYAFYRTRISSITIPNNVLTINNYAFAEIYYPAEHKGLRSITFDNNMTVTLGMYCFAGNIYLTTLNNFDIDGIVSHNIPSNCFNQSALEGDISLGSYATVGSRAFRNDYSAGILYIHLAQTDASALTSSYSFGAGTTAANRSFDLDHCRLVVPVGMLSDYQSAFPNYSSIMMEETS